MNEFVSEGVFAYSHSIDTPAGIRITVSIEAPKKQPDRDECGELAQMAALHALRLVERAETTSRLVREQRRVGVPF